LFGWAYNVSTAILGVVPDISVGPISTHSTTNLLYAIGLFLGMLFCYLAMPVLAAIFAPVYSFKQDEEGQKLKEEGLKKRRLRDIARDALREVPGVIAGIGSANIRGARARTYSDAPEGVIYASGPTIPRLTDQGEVVEGRVRELPALPGPGPSQGSKGGSGGDKPDSGTSDPGRKRDSSLRDSVRGTAGPSSSGESPIVTSGEAESSSDSLRETLGPTSEEGQKPSVLRDEAPNIGHVAGAIPSDAAEVAGESTLRESERAMPVSEEDSPKRLRDQAVEAGKKQTQNNQWFSRAYFGGQAKAARALADANPQFLPARAAMEGLTGLLSGNSTLREDAPESSEIGHAPQSLDKADAEQGWRERAFSRIRGRRAKTRKDRKQLREEDSG